MLEKVTDINSQNSNKDKITEKKNDFVFIAVPWICICWCFPVLSLSHSIGKFVYFIFST